MARCRDPAGSRGLLGPYCGDRAGAGSDPSSRILATAGVVVAGALALAVAPRYLDELLGGWDGGLLRSAGREGRDLLELLGAASRARDRDRLRSGVRCARSRGDRAFDRLTFSGSELPERYASGVLAPTYRIASGQLRPGDRARVDPSVLAVLLRYDPERPRG